MDYTGCPTEFTGGQRAVAANALSTDRASFLTSLALVPNALATVNFYTPATSVCLGERLQFTDDSSCTPNTYTNSPNPRVSFLWTFDNKVNPPFTSTLQNPDITFVNSGLYDVTLAITNSKGTASLTKQKNIYVVSGLTAACSVSSTNKNGNFGIGVTRVSFNDIDNATSTFIPTSASNDFSRKYLSFKCKL
jgi:PKD repeat protein